MSIIQLRVVGTGLLYLLIFLSGFWLSRSGAPYSTIILTIHKLITLTAIIFFARIIYQIHQAGRLSAIEVIMVVVTGLLLVGTIISGGLLSTNKPMPVAILTMHQITPFLTVLSTAVMLYVLLSRKS
jgi:hypothetical protein